MYISSSEKKEKFASRLRKLRVDADYKQKDLATELTVLSIRENMDRRYTNVNVSTWERGALPDTYTIRLLAKLFDCSIDYIMGQSNKKVDTSTISTDILIAEDGYQPIISKDPLRVKNLASMHGLPIYLSSNRWGLYNKDTHSLLFVDGSVVRVDKLDLDDERLYAYPMYLSQGILDPANLLTVEAALEADRVWLQMMGENESLNNAYNGWYKYNRQTEAFEGSENVIPVNWVGKCCYPFSQPYTV